MCFVADRSGPRARALASLARRAPGGNAPRSRPHAGAAVSSATLSLPYLSCVKSPPSLPPSFFATLPSFLFLPHLSSLALRNSPFPFIPPLLCTLPSSLSSLSSVPRPPQLPLPLSSSVTHPLSSFPAGINVFAVILHTHLLGRKVRVRHLRDGRELEPIAQDNNYDFNYQEYRALNTPRTVLPGDHLIGECTYNSRERSTITLGGFKTRDEMCLSFLFYWPRVDLSLCHSKPSLNTVLHSLGIQELSADSDPIKIRRPIELSGKTLEWRLLNYDWKNQFEYFQAATHTGTINPMCWRRGESLLPELEKMDYDYPNITEPWAPENVCRQLRRISRAARTRRAEEEPPPHPHGETEETWRRRS
ncbi:putative MOXD1-like 2 [Penaeus vannamei]|uniref:Putative MOXD1-like 2 n=1 Tax=Penaeus vannamei TaxID=6689 RepID=A0A3R7P9U4_PENVA|nr:putative MOXD1-like 2 [Penaeus vannamei]